MSSNWYIKYNLTWYSSKELNNYINDISSYANVSKIYNQPPNPNPNPDQPDPNTSATNATILTSYKYRGFDANIILGRDLLKQDNYFLGLGGLIGISIPEIKSKNSTEYSEYVKKLYKNSDTKIKTYKYGINLTTGGNFTPLFKIFISANYAYQVGKIKNKVIDLDINAKGTYQSLEGNLRFTPINYKKRIGIITFNPRFYFTCGYKYYMWKLNKVSINTISINLKDYKSTLEFKTSVVYLGFGYSF